MRRRSTVLLLLALLAQTARAEERSQAAQAQAHFAAGTERYRAGRYEEALAEFELGYALSPRPEFLINFAQTRRKLGQYEGAIVECERYLATAPPPALAEEARRLLTVLREEQAGAAARARREPPPAEPAPPVAAAPAPVAAAPAPVAAVAPPPPVAVAAPPRHKSRAWVWGVVVGAALVVGAGVALAVVFSPTSELYPSEPLGRVSFR